MNCRITSVSSASVIFFHVSILWQAVLSDIYARTLVSCIYNVISSRFRADDSQSIEGPGGPRLEAAELQKCMPWLMWLHEYRQFFCQVCMHFEWAFYSFWPYSEKQWAVWITVTSLLFLLPPLPPVTQQCVQNEWLSLPHQQVSSLVGLNLAMQLWNAVSCKHLHRWCAPF